MRFFYPQLLILLFFLTVHFFYTQDTIYVYEEEVIYDTVYVDQKKELIKIDVGKEEKKPTKTITNISRSSSPILFGARIVGATKSQNFFRSIRDLHNLGYGGGFWLEQSVFSPKFSLYFSGDFVKWNSNFSFDENESTTQLSGYYFNEKGTPALFRKFSDQHNEILTTLRGKYTIKNFSFSGGINLNYYQLNMEFLIPENFRLIKPANFKNHNMSLGYSGAVQFLFNTRFAMFLEYHTNYFRKMEFQNEEFGSISFQIENVPKIRDQKFFFGISYRFSK